jgi:glycosyltransferase involved in cell wall biosynthesis
MIWSSEYVEKIYQRGHDDKKDRTVWPHRISKEKGIDDFILIAEKNFLSDYVITSCGNIPKVDLPSNVEVKANLTKHEYYQVLSNSKYYLSTAYQETFGYTLQEAIYYGCLIAVPNRAAYPEMVPSRCLFDSLDDIKFNPVGELYEGVYDENVKKIIKAALI